MNRPLSDLADTLILEGIVVTQDARGRPNIAPMGPRVDRSLTQIVLKPFATSQTYQNLVEIPCGVLHVTDDVLLIAQAAVGRLDPAPAFVDVPDFPCPRLADCCRWLAFRALVPENRTEPRLEIRCEVAAAGEVRPFFGFNRAKHAVLEAAILATRISILPESEIRREMTRLAIPIQKTAGHQEREAFAYLQHFLETGLQKSSA